MAISECHGSVDQCRGNVPFERRRPNRNDWAFPLWAGCPINGIAALRLCKEHDSLVVPSVTSWIVSAWHSPVQRCMYGHLATWGITTVAAMVAGVLLVILLRLEALSAVSLKRRADLHAFNSPMARVM
jgi:hypothetical protein